ncbi:MAG TPA: dTDP-4-amino-4,6-dideoxygalactose transaminase [Solirubrobacteraceae bacterium]|nr:dTDP-4-amino-4,6-dideoxygalactose transaminase [Solirubrobacteraceae bacterium]
MFDDEKHQRVPFNVPHLTGRELAYVQAAIAARRFAGNGPFGDRCAAWLRETTRAEAALLVHSATAALEMAALLCEVQAGDEVLMPSYTFVSTANAFVLRGAVPVFCEIRADTLNLDEDGLEAAITPRTRAIVAVHYGGVACEMDAILALAERHGLRVIEDAAQGLAATYRDRPLGSIGDAAALSFHESKNVMSGEGGALLVNDAAWAQRAEILQEKGTDRRSFFRGEVAEYTWRDVGSSYLLGELPAAFLLAQLEDTDRITADRLASWDRYHERLAPLEELGRARRPVVPPHCSHNAHLYYLLLSDHETRDRVIRALVTEGVGAVFHYVPLHASPAGRRYGRAAGELPVTDSSAARLVRLPMWTGMGECDVDRVIEVVYGALGVPVPVAA